MKVIKRLYQYFKALIYGMGETEKNILHYTTSDADGIVINQEVHSKRVSKDLLKGIVSQEVEELRYRTYKVDREAKTYEYFSPTLAKKRDKMDTKFVTYENEDKLPIITIQPNQPRVQTVNEALEQVGKRGKSVDYWIEIERDFMCRYRLEEYTKRLVVKELIKDQTVILDFYVSKYPNDKDFKSKGFVREIEKIKDEGMKSDVLDFDRVKFTTLHAYKVDDMLLYIFDKIYFQKVVEFDGHYIVRFKAHIFCNGTDLTDEYYSKTMDEKYQTHAPKESSINLNGNNVTEIYRCEECGKEIIYDTELINSLPIKPIVDDGEESEEEETNQDDGVTNYLDIQMVEQTIGKRLCNECLKKYLKENNLI